MNSVAIDPRALILQGIDRHQQGDIAAAAAAYEQVLTVWPNNFDALHLLGVIALQREDYGQAEQLITRALTVNQLEPAALGNLGLSHLRNGQLQLAIHWFQIALKLRPHSAEAMENLSAAQALSRQRADAARQRGTKAMDLAPTLPVLLLSATVLLANGFNEDAIAALERALLLDGNSLRIRWVIAHAVLRSVYRSDAQMTDARQSFADALDEIRIWYRNAPAPPAGHEVVGVIQPFGLAYHPGNNRAILGKYGSLCSTWMATLGDPEHRGRVGAAPGKKGRLDCRFRLGLVSSQIREHSVWAAITKGWVRHLDRRRIDLHIFCLNETRDEETEVARRSAAHFVTGRTGVRDWADTITRCELDGLIYPEIGMDGLTMQLAAMRLAPWQAVSWGHPETSGLPTLDAYLSSELMEPANAVGNYTENLLRLPNLGVYCEPLAPEAIEVDLPSLGLPLDEPLLLCPGSPFKYLPRDDEVWVQIAKKLRKRLLRRGPGGRLVFFRSRAENSDDLLERRLRSAFVAAGLDFKAHVSLLPYLDRARYFGLMRKSALMLDTLRFSGFNTAIQAVECGLPMLTFEGEFLRGRLASGVMRRLDLPELIAVEPREFIEKAVDLVMRPAKLGDLRQKIIQRRDVLFRDLAPVRALEDHLAAKISA